MHAYRDEPVFVTGLWEATASFLKARGIDELKDDFFLDVIFDPAGKYGAYGAVEERKVVSSNSVALTVPGGGTQSYRRLALKHNMVIQLPRPRVPLLVPGTQGRPLLPVAITAEGCV